MIRVLVIDDHPVMRTGLEALLRAEPGFVCVGSAPVAAAHRLVRRQRPDVVIFTRDPEFPPLGAAIVVDDARDPDALFDRVRIPVRERAAA